MNTIQLNPTQHAVLAHAVENTNGKITWFPANVKGGARQKVIAGLLNRALITPLGEDWFVAAEAYDALGLPRPTPITLAKLDAVIANAEAAQRTEAPKPRSRDHSKQASVIQMLRRPEGATIPQICEITGWQRHTVRGAFAGAFKKKLGLTITSAKPLGGERTYYVAS